MKDALTPGLERFKRTIANVAGQIGVSLDTEDAGPSDGFAQLEKKYGKARANKALDRLQNDLDSAA